MKKGFQKKTCKVSLITIVLNNAQGLRETATSVRTQERGDVEWIVIDGGSKDRTLDVIDENKDIITSWISEPDHGLYDAMNKGLTRASGTFVLFLNSGDRLADGVLAKVVTEIKTLDTDRIGFLVGEVIQEFPSGRTRHRKAQRLADVIWHRLPGSHQTIFILREAHLKALHGQNFSVSSDYMTIASIYKMGYSDKTLPFVVASVPMGGSSYSSNHPITMLQNHIRIQRNILGVSWTKITLSLARKIVMIAGVYVYSKIPSK